VVCTKGAVSGEGVDCGPEAGNSNPKSLSSAVRTATTFKEKSAKDFRARDMVTSVLRSVSLHCLCCVKGPQHSLIILRANHVAGVKRMTIKRIQISCDRPVVLRVHQS